MSGDEITDKSKAELVKLLVEHFEKPEEPKRKGRFGRRNSSKKSPESSKSESKVSESEKSENGQIPVSTELDITSEIIAPVQTKTNAVEVN